MTFLVPRLHYVQSFIISPLKCRAFQGRSSHSLSSIHRGLRATRQTGILRRGSKVDIANGRKKNRRGSAEPSTVQMSEQDVEMMITGDQFSLAKSDSPSTHSRYKMVKEERNMDSKRIFNKPREMRREVDNPSANRRIEIGTKLQIMNSIIEKTQKVSKNMNKNRESSREMRMSRVSSESMEPKERWKSTETRELTGWWKSMELREPKIPENSRELKKQRLNRKRLLGFESKPELQAADMTSSTAPTPATKLVSLRDDVRNTERERRVNDDTGSSRKNNMSDLFQPRRPAARESKFIFTRHTAASQFLYGSTTVKAALCGPRKLYKLYILRGYLDAKQEEDELMAKLARDAKVPVQYLKREDEWEMNRISERRPHNGYILEASPLPIQPLVCLGSVGRISRGKPHFEIELDYQQEEEKAINGEERLVPFPPHDGRNPLLLFINGVKDEGNLGSIIRTAVFMGVNGIVLAKKHTASLTPVTLKASTGAAEQIKLFSVNHPERFAEISRKNGWTFYAGVPKPTNKAITTHRLEQEEDPLIQTPCVLMIGAEGDGLPWEIQRQADREVTIPSNIADDRYGLDSLNASVAAAILINSMVRPRSIPVMRPKTDKVLF